MNAPDPDDNALSSWAQNLPPPVLREEARRSSLAAALAALEQPSPSPTPAVAKVRPFLPRFSRFHLASLAACWMLAGYFHYSAPRAPGDASTSSGGSLAAWPVHFSAPMDEETARLLATIYPARSFTTP